MKILEGKIIWQIIKDNATAGIFTLAFISAGVTGLHWFVADQAKGQVGKQFEEQIYPKLVDIRGTIATNTTKIETNTNNIQTVKEDINEIKKDIREIRTNIRDLDGKFSGKLESVTKDISWIRGYLEKEHLEKKHK
ncbi:MAG: hypothetical protein OXI53_10580 [Nitrospira sp.]|nr:hypothetical protein [Nitrospira sp.]MDE0405746.1 hypothetical protein [Nitrospira sp.]MDE0486658.1 hypothetical protein [Nitrospira sp.]